MTSRGQVVLGALSIVLIGVAAWLTFDPVSPEPGTHPSFSDPDADCPALLPEFGESLCPGPLAERAVQVSALFSVGVLGLVAASLLDQLETRGWPRRLPWSVAAGLIVPVLAMVGIRLGQQHDHFVEGIPLALLVPGLLVVVAGCVSLVRAVWPTLALGLGIGLAQAVPLTYFMHQIWSKFGS